MCNCNCDDEKPFGYKEPNFKMSKEEREREVSAARDVMIKMGYKNVPSLEEMMEPYNTTE